jgi:hypothetical protein
MIIFILYVKFSLMAARIIFQGSHLAQSNGYSLHHSLFKWVCKLGMHAQLQTQI